MRGLIMALFAFDSPAPGAAVAGGGVSPRPTKPPPKNTTATTV